MPLYPNTVKPWAVTSKTATYSIAPTDNVILCSGAAFTVTLPTAVGIAGQEFVIKKTDSTLANIITVATTSSQTIDGSTTTTLNSQYDTVVVVSDGANWQVLDRIVSVNARYTTTATVIGTTATDVVYTVKDFDTHGTYNTSTGVYTVPTGCGGKYRVTGSVVWTAVGNASSTDAKVSLLVYKGVSLHSSLPSWTSQVNSANFDGTLSGSTLINCVAGDTFKIVGNRSSSLTSYSANSSATGDFILIERVGS